ncbi:hypothetical protein [Chelatococcus asaccharovorans]|uniref:hypothetical protein n=1 Tax=Chelatococcus asaccharovorans TaxID=28210 RepID=UPI00224C754F|nr:hypothetical protein [Chelatococcus asaccharovorans]CAH1657144.1 hypothetical protein CHELA40_11380 [Chelatococcus asaccharovorans]CAH1684879.1 hypothetical protein CHELA17_64220 [Chelatococcus asaccharovorans]
MADAIELSRYYLSEYARLSDVARISTETREAEALRVWLLNRSKGDAVLFSQMLQFGPNRLRDRARLLRAINVLIEAGWLERLPPRDSR